MLGHYNIDGYKKISETVHNFLTSYEFMIKIRDKYLVIIIPFVNYDKNLIEIINNIKNRKI